MREHATAFLSGRRAGRQPTPKFVWGFVSQGASSVTNFGLSLLAGIFLGPQGLGVVFIGFTAYLLALGFQRSLFTDPLIATSSSSEAAHRTADSRAALSGCLLWASGACIAFVSIGIGVGGDVGGGLLAFAPWILPALIQDFWRAVLFRDGRDRAGAFNDVTWMITMAAATPIALLHPTEWTIVACWGIGAIVSTLLGFRQTLFLPERLATARRWWRSKGWPLGRWLATESFVYVLGAQGLVILLVPIVGTDALGGLRAVQTIFAPLSLLAPALYLPAFPYLSRTVGEFQTQAGAFATRLGAVAAILTGLYVLGAAAIGSVLLGLVFGDAFTQFTSLIWPVGLGELAVAGTLGFSMLIKAERRGRAILFCRSIGSLSALVFTVSLAFVSGIEGAAWGMTLGAALGAAAVAIAANVRRGTSLGVRGTRPGPREGQNPAQPPRPSETIRSRDE
jgi:O-antigen/teichoic acid export membrane protein